MIGESSKANGYSSTAALFGITAIAASLVIGYRMGRRQIDSKFAKESIIPSLSDAHNSSKSLLSIPNIDDTQPKELPPEIKMELLSRIESFFGEDSFKKIENAYVVVVGLGGVGSHAASSLVRSGVGRIKFIDFDQVSVSSLNRHSTATLADVGTPKVTALQKALLRVSPWCRISTCAEMFCAAEAFRLLSSDGVPDFVLDCIDDINTKSELIEFCVQKNIRILVSMGAGGKADPTRLRISPLVDCANDPLATKLKWKLRKMNVPYDKVMSIYSIEKPKVDLLPLTEEQRNNPQGFGAVDNFRVRVMPVLGTSPSMFGQAMASFVLCTLADKPYEPEGFEGLSKNLKWKILQMLRKNEVLRFKTDENVDIDDNDIEFIVQVVRFVYPMPC